MAHRSKGSKPLAITVAPLQPLRHRTATETNARAGEIGKKNLQNSIEEEETQKYFSAPLRPASATTLPAQQNVVAFDDMLDPQLREYDQIEKESRKQLSKAWQTRCSFMLEKWMLTMTTLLISSRLRCTNGRCRFCYA